MSAAAYPVQGNLAIAVPADQPSRSFTLVEGGRATRCASSVKVAPRILSAPRALTVQRAIMLAGIFILTLAALLGAGWAASAGAASARTEAVGSATFEPVTVEAGDSLWSLATEHPIEGLSTQETSDAIRDRNQLETALLQPGMELEVPCA